MKVGSLVECVNAKPSIRMIVGIVKPLIEGAIYTIRGFDECPLGGVGVYLEEIENDIHVSGLEYSYFAERFRELQPPMSLDFINELQTSLTV